MVAFRPGRRFRVIATRANHQPALGVYVAEPHARILHANGLVVLTLAGDRIAAMTRFDKHRAAPARAAADAPALIYARGIPGKRAPG